MRSATFLLAILTLSACATAQETPRPAEPRPAGSQPGGEAATTDPRPHVVDGREGVVMIPANDGGLAPLVLLLHGFGSDGATFASERDALVRNARSRGWIVAAPTGAPCLDRPGHCWASRDDPESIAVSTADDVSFLRAVVDDLSLIARVDLSRVYIVGFSNGASMAHRFAAEAPEVVTAGAAVAGTIGRTPSKREYSFTVTPQPLAPVSMLIVKGLQDEVFPYFGGSLRTAYDVLQAEYETNFWAEANGCEIGTQVRENLSRTFPDQIPGGVGSMEYREGCRAGTVVRMVALKDLGHAWPLASDRYDADTEILAFFDRLPR